MRANMRKNKSFHLWVILSGVLFLTFSVLLGFAPSTLAQPATQAPHYAGKMITFVSGTGPGAGSDIMARLIARHITKFIPGNPKIVIRSMTEAGGIACPNYMYRRAKPDGLTLMAGSLETIMNGIFQTPGIEYKLLDMPCLFGYLGGSIMIVKPQIARNLRIS